MAKLILVLVLLMATITVAQVPQKYMVIMQGAAGLDFYCTDELPYTLQREQDNYADYAGHVDELELRAQVIMVDECNVTNLYDSPDGLFAWGFSYRVTDGHEEHRHISGGAYWVLFRDLTP